jgi:hypothetical protein
MFSAAQANGTMEILNFPCHGNWYGGVELSKYGIFRLDSVPWHLKVKKMKRRVFVFFQYWFFLLFIVNIVVFP